MAPSLAVVVTIAKCEKMKLVLKGELKEGVGGIKV